MHRNLYDKIQEYLVEYAERNGILINSSLGLIFRDQTLILEHVLVDSRKSLPGKILDVDIGEKIRSIFSGKKVLELGCRSGLFLRFLRDHGAVVAGTTSGNHYQKAVGKLGRDAVLVKSLAENAGDHEQLRDFKPDFLFSYNLLDSNRESEKRSNLRKLYRSIQKIVGHNCKIYAALGVVDGSFVSPKAIRRLAVKNFRVLKKHHGGEPKDQKVQTIRFQLKRK